MPFKAHLVLAAVAAFVILSAFVIADELRWRAEVAGCEEQQTDPRLPPAWLCNGIEVTKTALNDAVIVVLALTALVASFFSRPIERDAFRCA